MTFNSRQDSKTIQDYFKELSEKHKGKEINEIRKEIIGQFKEEEKPKILIVTDMLLTGFDAPIPQTMYLDKPLKEHRLLQAIVRTNRPYLKEAGAIVDYLGILKEFKRAFEIYSKEEINGAIQNIEDLREEFVRLLERTLEIFEGIPKDKFDRKTLLYAVEVLTSDENMAKAFMQNYKSLRKMFELLGLHTIKAQKFSEYRCITAIYIYYLRLVFREASSEEWTYVQKYFDKTVKFVHKSTELEQLQDKLPVINFDEQYLRGLDEKVKSKEEKAANIVFTLNRFVLVDRYKNPINETLAEKVEKILKLWKEKTKDFERIYKEGTKIIQELSKGCERQKELGFSNIDYSLLLALEEKFPKDTETVKDVKELSKSLKNHLFTDWILQPTAKKNVEREIRTFLRRYIKRHNLKLSELESLYQKMIENVKAYGKNI